MSKKFFVEEISGGAALGIKLELTRFENVSPHFSAAVKGKPVTEEFGAEQSYDMSVGREMTEEEITAEIKQLHDICRRAVEERIDEDIHDIKGTKIFQEVLNAKMKKGGK